MKLQKFSPAEIIVNNLLFNTREECQKIRDRFNVFISKEDDTSFQVIIRIRA